MSDFETYLQVRAFRPHLVVRERQPPPARIGWRGVGFGVLLVLAAIGAGHLLAALLRFP